MERLFTYWIKHCPGLEAETKQFVLANHAVETYPKNTVVKLPDQEFSFWGMVLDGQLGAYVIDASGDPVLVELFLPLDFFTGTEHLFTQRNRKIEYRALEKSTVLLLSNKGAREGQQRYREVAELFHVLKQKRIQFLRNLLLVYMEKDYYARYCTYRRLFRDVIPFLAHNVQWQLLRMGESSYYRVKKKYLESDGK